MASDNNQLHMLNRGCYENHTNVDNIYIGVYISLKARSPVQRTNLILARGITGYREITQD